MSVNDHGRIWPISLHQIEATVSAYLGPGRVPGNHQGSAFSRQVAMYLAKHVGRWSTTRIGKFYNGRHHTTVLYAIDKIERLRQKDASLDEFMEREISVWGEHSQVRTGSTSSSLVGKFVNRMWPPTYPTTRARRESPRKTGDNRPLPE